MSKIRQTSTALTLLFVLQARRAPLDPGVMSNRAISQEVTSSFASAASEALKVFVLCLQLLLFFVTFF